MNAATATATPTANYLPYMDHQAVVSLLFSIECAMEAAPAAMPRDEYRAMRRDRDAVLRELTERRGLAEADIRASLGAL